MAGRTDAWILADARGCARHPAATRPSLARFRDVYLRHLVASSKSPVARKGVMPGVRELLDALSARDDVYLALLTGNYEAGARLKLEYFDLWRYFPCGAFGDDAPNRNGLLPKALARVAACGGPSFAAARCGRDRRYAARRRVRGGRRRAIDRGRDRQLQRRRAARSGSRCGASGSQRHRRRCCDAIADLVSNGLRMWIARSRDQRCGGGGSAWESNPASPRERGATDFEDREGHRAPFTSVGEL